MTSNVIVGILCVLLVGVGCAEAKAIGRSRNGIRLVGGNVFKGRLEVSSRDAWVSGEEGKVGWTAVCDDGGFDDDMALIMCKLLDYNYGRKYYSPKVAYPKDGVATTDGYERIGQLMCGRPFRGRHLSSQATDATLATAIQGDGASTDEVVGSQDRVRSLLSPMRGEANIPDTAPYACQFSAGYCKSTGPFVGIQCSKKPLRTAPPPPPQPPSPPPAPPLVSLLIHLVTPEPNVCSVGDCMLDARVEVQVNAPGKGQIWAPVCNPPPEIADRVAFVACHQAYDWRKAFGGRFDTINARLAEAPFTIPQGPATAEGGFDPATYKGWVSIVGGDFEAAKTVQDFEHKVSTTECEEGAMLAVRCLTYGRRSS